MRLGNIGSSNKTSIGGIYNQEDNLEFQRLNGEIDSYVYKNKSYSISANVLNAESLVITKDGKYMYVIDSTTGSQSIDRYNFSTPFEVDTLSYSQTLSITTIITSPRGIFINDDGTRILVSDAGGDLIHNWYLPTPYSLTGSIWGNIKIKQVYGTSSTFTGLDLSPHGFTFSNDGMKMYFVGTDLDRIYQYNLSTAWDVTTASFASKTLSVSAKDTEPRAISISSDGTKIYVIGQSSDSVHQYNMSTAWEVDTATFSSTFSISSQEGSPTGIFFKPDGTKMYIVGTGNDTVYQYTLSSAWDISTASYDSKSYSVTSNDTFPSGLAFSNDGTKMFICADSGNSVDMFTLSTAWDVSTSSFTGETVLSGSPLSLSGLNDIFITPDGNTIYILDGTKGVYQFETLSSNDSRYMNLGSYSVSAYSTSPAGVTFSSDGKKMFVVDDAAATPNDRVYQWNLSVPWVPTLGGATYSSGYSISTQEATPTDLCFNKNGTRMLVVGNTNDRLYQYNLSTSYDISTTSYSQKAIELNDIETTPTGICISESGHRIYVVGSNSDRIYQFDYVF